MGFRCSVTSYILINSDNKNLYSKTKKNISFDTKLVRKTNSNFYLSLGGKISTNYNLGFEPMLINERSKDLYDALYGEISLNYWFFSYDKNIKLSKTDFDLPIELVKIKHNLKNQRIKLNKKDKEHNKSFIKRLCN